MTPQRLFWNLFRADREGAVDDMINGHSEFQDPANWRPYGQNESNFGVVENQQASPIPALVEKIINSIDAILMRCCHEANIDPRSMEAPRTMDEAVRSFFPRSRDWDLGTSRRQQAERIQIIADGPRFETSLLIYDDGEGQHPDDFEDTFLSLLRGNKNEIHFVQGKYNMGGAGAIAFCGQKRYQLVGSRKWDESGNFGFTLIRRHPLTEQEKSTKRNTWYEYFAPNGCIPSFSIQKLNLGLRNRQFTTGTIVKLYSYDLPSGSRSVISRDLNQSLNEYLFNPALPFFTIDQESRYPHDRNLQRDIYGLKRRLEENSRGFVEHSFSESLSDSEIGSAKITTYVFRPRVGDRNVRETKQTIRREFFKNKMTVIFSVNGQVHGHYTQEFVSRTLKFQLLKDYVLIHVDCTELHIDFRQELFMASRDRLKNGKESQELRKRLGELLRGGRLKEIYKERKAKISIDDADADNLLRSLTRNLPFRNELMRLFNHTLKIKGSGKGRPKKKRHPRKPAKQGPQPAPFDSKHYPSFFKAEVRDSENGTPMIQIPLGGQRTIKFSTDVENHYFDRSVEPGELSIALLKFGSSEEKGPHPPVPNDVSQAFNVVKSSPHLGTIKLGLKPTKDVRVGDAITISAKLTGPTGDFQENILVKITDRESGKPAPKGHSDRDLELGLPKLVRAYKDKRNGHLTWEDLERQGVEMGHHIVVHPEIDGDVLTKIYVNMESRVFLNHRAALKSEEAIDVAQKRYISSVYFHTLFLYTITKSRTYTLQQREDDSNSRDVAVEEYLKDLFSHHYAEFLLRFEMDQLISALED